MLRRKTRWTVMFCSVAVLMTRDPICRQAQAQDTFDRIKADWKAARYGKALDPLIEYWNGLGGANNLAVDYMLAVSLCKLPEHHDAGCEYFRAMKATYDFGQPLYIDGSSFQLSRGMQECCPAPPEREAGVSVSMITLGPRKRADILHQVRPGGQNAAKRCFDLVQRQIAWDYEGNKTWNTANVENLCRGTSIPSEPPRCFDRTMRGGINWGGGTRWDWKNALELCAGTNDADRTVSCFQAQIRQGVQWPNAVRTCKADSSR